MTITEIGASLEAATPELVSEKISGKEYWTTNFAQDHATYEESDAHLLPGFDEYLLGYKDHGAVLAEEHA